MYISPLFPEMPLTVGDVAAELLLSIDTVRRWEKKGLIRASRDVRGQRLFDLEEVRLLKQKLNEKPTGCFSVLKSEIETPYTVIELFAGAGGLALGLENAGLKATALVEIDKQAAATLQKNRPVWNVYQQDVRSINFSGHNADVVTGGFPCQAFSYAGKKLGFEDTRGTLFFEYARIVKEVNPKIIVAENVRGLLNHDNGRTFQTMLSVLDELGYRLEHRILRAQYLDVAQKRERLVVFGIRKDFNIPTVFPKECQYTVSLREALEGVPVSVGQQYTVKKKTLMSLIPEGGYWRNLPDNLQREYMGASYFMGGGKTGMARRLSWDEPSLTLTCNPAQKQTERCHPEETRPLTIREYARVQSFPDNWEFTGSTASQYRQIGNAVPVNLGYHIGVCLKQMLDQLEPNASSK
ncbi:MAG: DNA (cytosine-5-)-methyltransferase [Desulfuromonadaceae bacterium]|nr:DNA (cytosine-5-)-methyltransferase [Desulfuromonadaceae bacterium]MDD2854408.1 DNA (cytosine-5-)-methyltransferase [Desulfuromonadaceae bacterium]